MKKVQAKRQMVQKVNIFLVNELKQNYKAEINDTLQNYYQMVRNQPRLQAYNLSLSQSFK